MCRAIGTAEINTHLWCVQLFESHCWCHTGNNSLLFPLARVFVCFSFLYVCLDPSLHAVLHYLQFFGILLTEEVQRWQEMMTIFNIQHKHYSSICHANPQFPITVYPKMKMTLLFTHPHVIVNVYDFLLWNNGEFLKLILVILFKVWAVKLQNDKKAPYNLSIWLKTMDRHTGLERHEVNKRWQNDHFWVNYHFKYYINGSFSISLVWVTGR